MEFLPEYSPHRTTLRQLLPAFASVFAFGRQTVRKQVAIRMDRYFSFSYQSPADLLSPKKNSIPVTSPYVMRSFRFLGDIMSTDIGRRSQCQRKFAGVGLSNPGRAFRSGADRARTADVAGPFARRERSRFGIGPFDDNFRPQTTRI